MAGRVVSSLRIDIDAGTAKAVLEMNTLNATFTDFGKRARVASGEAGAFQRSLNGIGTHGVSQMQATSGALRVLEGGLNNNLRAAERFIASISGLGPILQAAFPLVGGIAFAGLLLKLGEEVHKFYTDVRDAPEKIQSAFLSLHASSRLANDEIALTNTRLENQIAKLEGKHQNILKEEMMEARVEADKLGESLLKAFNNLNKLLQEHANSTAQRLAGLASDADINELFGGKSGVGGVGLRLGEKLEAGNKEISDIVERFSQRSAADQAKFGAQDKADLEAARQRQRIAAEKELKDALDETNKKIAERQKLVGLNQGKVATFVVTPPKGESGVSGFLDALTNPLGFGEKGGGVKIVQDEEQNIEKLKNARLEVIQAQRSLPLLLSNADLTSGLKKAEADKDLERQESPLQRVQRQLQEKLAESIEKLKAAGGDEAGKALAKGMAEAAKAISEVNQGLDRQHKNLTLINKDPTQSKTGRDFLNTSIQTARNEAEATFKNKVQEANAKLSDQLQNQRAINDTIGKGYEALAKVNVEIALQRDLGAVLYNDPGHAAEVQALREKALTAEIAKHTVEVNQANLARRDEISLEEALARAQSAGAEAARLATLQHTIAIMKRNRATQESIDLEITYYAASRSNEIEKQLYDINQQIAAIKNLSSAYGQGAEAVRKAELQNKLAQIADQGDQAIPGVLGIGQRGLAEVSKSQAEELQKPAEAAGNLVNMYKNQLLELAKEKEALAAITVTEDNRNDVARAYREILDAQLKVLVQQQLAQRDAMSGIRAFFLEMQEQAKSTAAIMYEALNSTIDKLSDNLTKALTGQKTEWAKMFQEIGRGILKETIKSELQTVLGPLGDLIPGVKKAKDAAKAASAFDKGWGKSAAQAWFVRIVGADQANKQQQQNGPGGGILNGNGGLLGTGQVPKAGGFLNFLKGLGGAFGGGGGVGGADGAASSTISYGGEAASGAGDAIDLSTEAVGAMALGGDVRPNQVYSWNENGKELFMSGAGGHIANAADTRQMMGGKRGGDLYIDARGTDPGLTRSNVVAGLRGYHDSAVSQSVRAVHQQSARTPARG